MHTLLGDSKLDFLALMLPTTIYANISGTLFTISNNTVNFPTYKVNATRIKQNATLYKFDKDLTACEIDTNINKAFKQHILGCVDKIYVRALNKQFTGFGNITCLKIIQHLKDKYYKISYGYQQANTLFMNALWDSNLPF